MALINRVAISNMLNFHGDSIQAEWYPRFRYECLDLRGHSTAINLTNGGGKTTLAEGIIGVLSRDRPLIQNTKNKMSPKKDGIWSHIQVELIRPEGSVAQNDLLSDQGNSHNGEHWVFGLCGHRSDQNIHYYFYKGRLEDLPIGTVSGTSKTLTPNSEFNETRRNLPGLVWGAIKEEWLDALIHKANLPLSVIRQLADYQKRGGQDTSALLYNITRRSGESYAEAFFYSVLAPTIMSGLMDQEGEEGEIFLEDTVGIALTSTVKAKRDTEDCLEKQNKLADSVSQLGNVMEIAYDYDKDKERYTTLFNSIQTDIHALTYLANDGNLPGIPKTDYPEGRLRSICLSLAIKPGSTQPMISDRGLGSLVGDDTKRLNQRANRNSVKRSKARQAIDFACDLEIQNPKRGSYPESFYTLKEAEKLIYLSESTLPKKMQCRELVEDLDAAFSWFENKSDTNPFREKLALTMHDVKQLTEDVRILDEKKDRLQIEQFNLQSRQTMMKKNEGYYQDLVATGLFSEEELSDLNKTTIQVDQDYKNAKDSKADLEHEKIKLEYLQPQFNEFTRIFGNESIPSIVLGKKERERESLSLEKALIAEESAALDSQISSNIENKHQADIVLATHRQDLDRKKLLRYAYTNFQEINGNANPKQWLTDTESRFTDLKINIKLKKAELKVLEKRRATLDTNLVAPNDIALQTQQCLDNQNIAYTPLHAFVGDLNLIEERKREILSAFSAALFAPIINSSNVALKAAKLLDYEGLQYPVFLDSSFHDYCKSGSIECIENGQLYVGTAAGVVTRAVECLLDPTLVEKEKVLLDGNISALKSEVEMHTLEAKNIDSNSEAIKIAREANSYIENGGESEYKNLEQTVSGIIQRVTDFEERAKSLGAQKLDYKKKDGEIDLRIKEVLTPTMTLTLETANTYLESEGPLFFSRYTDEFNRLDKIYFIAEERKSRKHLFAGAKSYLDSTKQSRSDSQINEQISKLSSEIEKARVDKRNKVEQKEYLKLALPKLLNVTEVIDLMAIKVMAKYRKVASTPIDAPLDVVAIENEEVVKIANDLRFMLSNKSEIESLTEKSRELTDAVERIETDRKGDELRRAQKRLLEQEERFVTKSRDLVNVDNGLSLVERKILEDVKDEAGMKEVRILHEGLLAQMEERKERVRLCINAEKESRRGVTLRLSTLIEDATTDLKILSNVVGKKRGIHKSYFRVKAQVLDLKSIEKLINSILGEVEILEDQRRVRRSKGMTLSNDSLVQKDVKTLIRETLYRKIFTEPSITYANSMIRASGEENEFNEKLSEGQKAALSLMWTIRLAEFAIVREARKLSSRNAQNKAMSLSENILIIDGLFSNLSNKQLIDSTMDGIEATRGRFQLIGLIHNQHYQNDHDKFPVFIIGKSESAENKTKGWVSFADHSETDEGSECSLRTAQIRLVKTNENVNESE